MVPDLRPHNAVDLRLKANDIRSTHFLEFLRDNIFSVEQPERPFENSQLMSIILFTYYPDHREKKRLGFEARLENITPDHRVFFRQLSDPFPCDLRLWRRVELDVLPPVRAFCHDREIQVIDMSGGGAHIILRDNDCHAPANQTEVEMKFIFEDSEATLKSEITRQWTDPAGRKHVAVKFNDPKDIRKSIYK